MLERLGSRKRPFKIGDIVTVTTGKNANMGLKVISFTEDGRVVVSPSPEAVETKIFSVSEVYHYNDYKEAYKQMREGQN